MPVAAPLAAWTALLLAGVGFASLLALPRLASGQEAPAVEDDVGLAILQRHIEATGGVEAHRAAKTQKHVGTIEVPAVGLNGELTILLATPDKIRVNVELPQVGTFAQGAAGDVGWAMDPMNGPRIMADAERELLQQGLDPARLTEPARFYSSIRHDGEEDVVVPGRGSVKADKVTLVTKDGHELVEHYDRETGLRVRRAATWRTDFGPEQQISTFADYRDVGGGLLVPFVTLRESAGGEMTVRLREVVLHPAFADDPFAVPDEVQATMQGE
jgi:hypothetical protein